MSAEMFIAGFCIGGDGDNEQGKRKIPIAAVAVAQAEVADDYCCYCSQIPKELRMRKASSTASER